MARRTLGRLGFRVIAKATAHEGVEAARATSPSLIVLDIHLPDMSGWDVLALLSNDPSVRETPIMVVSIDEDRGRAMALGACQHMVKPVDRDAFAASVLQFARVQPRIAMADEPSELAVAKGAA